ncbi:MAG: GNAT family N-acetyltransferase [Nevskia sp.]|nr:GNAT family N-acetyltransferase [Nevskia sp.]
MISEYAIRLASAADAAAIAGMSREHIERGLGWRWREPRVLGSIRDRATNVAVAEHHARLSGFGIMKYSDDTAHLLLLAVDTAHRRKGLGAAILRWLEAVAHTAGVEKVLVEARAGNHDALAFYRHQGYRPAARIDGYYQGVEDGVRLVKRLLLEP